MKALTRVALYALAISVVPFSYSYAQDPVDLAPDMSAEEMIEMIEIDEFDADPQALEDELIAEEEESFDPPTLQEAKEALAAMPGAKHAVKGTVPVPKDLKIYDIYGRQLAYREGAKEYRKSIDKRREEFAKPRTEGIEKYKKTRDIIYAAETAEYQKKLREENEAVAVSEEAPKLPSGEAYEAVLEDAAPQEIGLKEHRVTTDASARKKVVTAGDAPEFDPARLYGVPVAVENVEPPLMPEVVQEEKAPVVEKAPEPVAEVAEKAPEVVAPVEEKAEEVVEEAVVEAPAAQEAVEEVQEEAVEEELDVDTEDLLSVDDLENPFGDEEAESPFAEAEPPSFND